MRETREKPVVGQIVYSVNIGNAARNCEQVATEVTVMKVGRKYFYAARESYQRSEYMWTKYSIDTYSEVTEYSANSCIYASKLEFEEKKRCHFLEKQISGEFRNSYSYNGKYSLSQLERIYLIINEEDIND